MIVINFNDWITAAGVRYELQLSTSPNPAISSFMFHLGAGAPFTAFDIISSAPVLPVGTPNILVIRYSAIHQVHDMRLNGSVVASSSTVLSVPLGNPQISALFWGGGPPSPFTGKLDYGDFYGFDTFLNTAQIVEVENTILSNV